MTDVIVLQETVAFKSLPDDVRIDLMMKKRAKYGDQNLFYDAENKTVTFQSTAPELQSETVNETDMDILKLQNATLLTEIDKLNAEIRRLTYDKKQTSGEYERNLLEKKAKENDKLFNLLEQVIIHNNELVEQIQFFSSHLCELCEMNDEDEEQMVQYIIDLQKKSKDFNAMFKRFS